MQATGTFAVKDWQENPYREFEGESKLTRASVKQTFQGDIEGEGNVEYLMAYREDKTADFVGILYVDGKIGERSGGFALRLSGAFNGSVAEGTLSVIPGLGTGELRTLRGKGEFTSPHGTEASFTLNYEFDDLAESDEKKINTAAYGSE